MSTWLPFPLNLIVGAVLTIAALVGLWVLGEEARRLFAHRMNSQRLHDLTDWQIQWEWMDSAARRLDERIKATEAEIESLMDGVKQWFEADDGDQCTGADTATERLSSARGDRFNRRFDRRQLPPH